MKRRDWTKLSLFTVVAILAASLMAYAVIETWVETVPGIIELPSVPLALYRV